MNPEAQVRRGQVDVAARRNLLSVKSVAAALGVTTATVYKLCERGALAHVRILNTIRVRAEDLDAFVRTGALHP